MGTRAWAATLFVSLILCVGCGKADDPDRIALTIHRLLDGKAPDHVSAEAWKDTHEFYKRRQDAPAWMMDDQRTNADVAVETLGRAREHGLDPANYDEQEIARLRSLAMSEDAPEKGSEQRTDALAASDVRITAALLPAVELDLVVDVVRAGGLLPEKATSFQPKPSLGSFIRLLDE